MRRQAREIARVAKAVHEGIAGMPGDESVTFMVRGEPPITTTTAKMRAALATVNGERQHVEGQADIEDTAPGAPGAETREVAGVAGDRLKSIVERVERLEEERKALGADIRDLFTEAKSAGFDVAVLRALLRLRAKNPVTVEEQETLLDIYKRAIGMD